MQTVYKVLTKKINKMADEIVNRVKKSKTKLLDLEDMYPEGERVLFDIAPYLWEGIALKEKDFREAVDAVNEEDYAGKFVAVHCSADAIVPTWAFMLVAAKLGQTAELLVCGDLEDLEKAVFDRLISTIDFEEYEGERVIIKGCSKRPVPLSAYVTLSEKLSRWAKHIMYGEPCSTVPVFKRKR